MLTISLLRHKPSAKWVMDAGLDKYALTYDINCSLIIDDIQLQDSRLEIFNKRNWTNPPPQVMEFEIVELSMIESRAYDARAVIEGD